ncbi:hypothetical protein B4U79_17186 [Dinothrombium tinctorium]|uniref:Uncharacterized protein n=1 Tax=Dinothrombium tinctorium TaxID=1965070 RepID=A0A443RRP7_9ACAR|nr:hypothetical protein B4U79_17186 [Dinothrombium tinctorium]
MNKEKIRLTEKLRTSNNEEKERILKAVLSRKQRLKSPQKQELTRSLFENNIDIKVALDSSVTIFANIVHSLFSSPILSICILCSLGYIYKATILQLDSKIIQLVFCFLSLGFLVLVAFVSALKDKFNFLTENVNDARYWLTVDDFDCLTHLLPWFVSDAQVEGAAWLNEILSVLWSRINAGVRKSLKQCVDQNGFLTESALGFPNDHTSFRITKDNLGSKSPQITGVHVVQRGVQRNQVIVDMEVTYDGDLNYRIAGRFKLVAGIEKFFIRTNIRAIIGPLMREKPTVKSIWVTLLKRPKIEWKFSGFLRFLNGQWLKYLISEILYSLYGNPNKFEINIAKYILQKEVRLREPLGVFRIDILEAVALPRSEVQVCCRSGKADAYCVVEYENEQKITHVVPTNDNPEWHRSFIFLYTGNHASFIKILIRDEEVEENDILGVFTAPISLFMEPEFNGLLFSTPLRDPDNAKFVKNGKTQLHFRISYFNLSTDIKSLKLSHGLMRRNLPVAVLTVLVDYATGLETAAKQVKTPELRSLVRVSVGNQVQVTSIKERTGYPIWEESLDFFLFNPHLEDIYIEVVDVYYVMEKRFLFLLPYSHKKIDHTDWVELSKEGTVVGYVKIPVSSIINTEGMKTDNIYQLLGYIAEGHIKISTSMRLTIYSQTVIDNQMKPRENFPEEEKAFADEEELIRQRQDILRK